MPKLPKIAVKAARFVAAIIPLVWIFSRTEFRQVSEAVHNTAWWTVPLLVVFTLSVMMMQGVRWWILLKVAGTSTSFRTAIKYHFIGIFYSIIIPGSAAQDIVKAALLSKEHNYSKVWGATWVFKLLGLFSLTLMSAYGFWRLEERAIPGGDRSYTFLVVVFIFLVLILAILSFSKQFTRPISPLFRKLLPHKFFDIASELRQGVYDFRHHKGQLAAGIVLSLIVQSALVINTIFVIKGISGRFYISAAFAFIPVIEILCMVLPLTPGGIGIREGLTVFMFEYLGLTEEHMAVYVLLGIIPILLKTVGGLPLLYGLVQPLKRRNYKKERKETSKSA